MLLSTGLLAGEHSVAESVGWQAVTESLLPKADTGVECFLSSTTSNC